MAISAHHKVSPITTVSPPRTTLKTLTLPPNQNANWCQGFPCRAAAGTWSMWRFRCTGAADRSAPRMQPFQVTLSGGISLVLPGAVGLGWAGVYRLAIRSAAFSAMASTVAFRGALGMTGITEASAIRSPVIPRTRSSGSTTAPG